AVTLDEKSGSRANGRKRFGRLQKRLASSGDAMRVQMAVVMAAFAVGLFARGGKQGMVQSRVTLGGATAVPAVSGIASAVEGYAQHGWHSRGPNGYPGTHSSGPGR